MGSPSQIELLALGDFPSRSYHLSSDASLDDVPLALREILVSVTSERGTAEGRSVSKPAADAQAIWVLPHGPSCPLGDELLNASQGAAVVALSQGGALIAGGRETDTLASSAAYLLAEGSETRTEVEGGMLLRREEASATLVGDVVVIAGGTADRRAGAHDTWELFDPTSAKFLAARSGKLKAPRMSHAALALPDGHILLVGGRAEADGAPLASAELLDPSAGMSEKLEPGLQIARVAPSALLLDSGRVLILGGRDDDDQVIGSIELYAPQERRFTLALSDLPVREEVAVASLPGARVAWMACDHAAAGCELSLISERDGELTSAPVSLDFTGLVANGLKQMRLLYVGDGQLLWTGADDSDPMGRRRAFVIDPASETLSRVDASRVPLQLLRLRNDLIAELDEAGVSLRAAFTHGRYASPEGNLLQSLVLDGPGRWLWEDRGVQALASGAGADLGELRFAAFRGSVSVTGDFSFVVYDGQGHGARASVRSGELQLGACRSQLQDGVLELERSGEVLSFAGTGCSLRVPDAPLGVALVLEQGSVLQELRVLRE